MLAPFMLRGSFPLHTAFDNPSVKLAIAGARRSQDERRPKLNLFRKKETRAKYVPGSCEGDLEVASVLRMQSNLEVNNLNFDAAIKLAFVLRTEFTTYLRS